MSDRFHRAARDGYLHVLKEATRRDCNHPDEDGLTPTSWAAYEGHLDALRLIVGRGGDPDKCDHYGNTALHCASARGHMSCVSFLVNFGVNVWSLDNDFHTAKDMAAMNNKEEILRYLDTVYAKQTMSDPKQVKKIQEKAQKDAEKRRKEFDKIQKKADKKREEENLKLQKEREKIERTDEKPQGGGGGGVKKSIINTISRGSLAFMGGPRKDSRQLYDNTYQSPKFSDLTTSKDHSKKTLGGMQKRIIRKKMMDENKGPNDFKVGMIESDGKKSMRNLKGFRRDSEIIFVPNGSLSSTNNGKRGKLTDVFEQDDEDGGGGRPLQRTLSQPDFFYDGQDQPNMNHRGSLFARPGFGSVAFRNNSITATLSSLAPSGSDDSSSPRLSPLQGSGSSLAHGTDTPEPWEEEDLPSDDESEATPVYLFLAAAGLTDFIPTFAREHIDMDALMLLTEEDLINLKLPLGPRRKLLKAIKERMSAIENPGEVEDSQL